QRMYAPKDTAVLLRDSLCSTIFNQTRTAKCLCPLDQKSRLPEDMPGVTRYPHPKSDKCLKSKAPASGVPARPRVFFLTPHEPTGSSFAMSNAPHRPGSETSLRTLSIGAQT